MFYQTGQNNHNLPKNPFKSCVVPRPIGWISSLNENGTVNLAPYSYFNAIADTPPMVMIASGFKADGSRKDSIRNIEAIGEFVINVATYQQRNKVNLSSSYLDYNTSEIEEFKIATKPSVLVKPPSVKASPINLECKYVKTINLDFDHYKVSSEVIIGHVIGINIDDYLLVEGKIDVARLHPIARLGYDQYAHIKTIFRLKRP